MSATTKMDYTFKWKGKLTKEMKNCYKEYGFFIASGFLDKEEVSQVLEVLKEPAGILKHGYTVAEDHGFKIQQTLSSYPGTDVTGMLVRSEKLVKTCEQLLEDEVYHWCSMFMIKDARVGGEHVWHQDYGFWYNDGCLYPDLITVWFPLDKTTKENSCKQVVPGSHKLGRLDHERVSRNSQLEANPDKVQQSIKAMGKVYLEVEAGDVFFHHSNLLHRSDENKSDKGRRAFLCAYNAMSNSPVTKSAYPQYNKIKIVPNSAIKDCTNYTDFRGKEFRQGA